MSASKDGTIDDDGDVGGKFQMDQLPAGVALWVMALCGMDTLVNAICLPVSALNFAMIAQTALLHRNLKFILLLQSACVALFSVSEIARKMPKLAHMDTFHEDWLTLATMKVTLVLVIFTDWLGFGLLCERILATIKRRTYEGDRRSHFSTICFLFLCSVTFYCYYSSVDLSGPTGVRMDPLFLCQMYSFLALSFLCMLVILFLLKYNKRLYAKMALSNGGGDGQYRQDLSIKYQISENIRTNRQLLPSAMFHFVDVLLTIALSLLSYYGLMGRSAIWNCASHNAIFLLLALSNVGMQISVIMMHPMLARKLRRMMAWKGRRHRVGPILENGAAASAGNAENGTDRKAQSWHGDNGPPKNIFGDNLLRQNADIGEYFKLLDSFWSNHEKITTKQRKDGRRRQNGRPLNVTIA